MKGWAVRRGRQQSWRGGRRAWVVIARRPQAQVVIARRPQADVAICSPGSGAASCPPEPDCFVALRAPRNDYGNSVRKNLLPAAGNRQSLRGGRRPTWQSARPAPERASCPPEPDCFVALRAPRNDYGSFLCERTCSLPPEHRAVIARRPQDLGSHCEEAAGRRGNLLARLRSGLPAHPSQIASSRCALLAMTMEASCANEPAPCRRNIGQSLRGGRRPTWQSAYLPSQALLYHESTNGEAGTTKLQQPDHKRRNTKGIVRRRPIQLFCCFRVL